MAMRRVDMYIDPNDWNDVKVVAKREGISCSAVIRCCIRKGLDL